MKPVASPAGSAARSAEHQAATARHSREQPASLVRLRGSGQNRAKPCAPVVKQQVNFPSSQVSACRQAAMASEQGLSIGFWSPPPSAEQRLRSAWSAAAGKFVAGQPGQRGADCVRSSSPKSVAPVAHYTSSRFLTLCCLTPRSSGAPTAWHTGHQALGLRPILRLLSSAPRCRRPLSSNVRPHTKCTLSNHSCASAGYAAAPIQPLGGHRRCLKQQPRLRKL